MSSVEDSAHLASDAELITSVRAGDRQAFGDLYSRHASAAAALARQFARSPAEADDLVSEAFARVLDGLLEGKGPDTAFRAYLFTTVRNTAYDRTRKDKRLQFTDDIESHDQPVELDDPVIADLENGLVGRAFAGLPERWQTVLWHVQVEGQSPTEVGVLMGMAPNAVSSLAFRAREGLREAYLQAHLAETAAQQCRTTVDRLGAWTRGGLSKRERAQVDAHLRECDRCPALAAELSEINTSLRGVLAPLLLGGAAAGYVATLGPIAPLVQLGTFTGGATVAGSSSVAITHGSVGAKAVAGKVFGGKAVLALGKVGPWAPGAAVAGAAAVVAGVVAAVIIAVAGGSSAPAVAGSQGAIPVAGSTVAGNNNGNGNGNAVGGGTDGGGTDGGGTVGAGGGTGGGGTGGATGGGSGSPLVPVVPGTSGTASSSATNAASSGPEAGSGPISGLPGTSGLVPGADGPGSSGPDGLGTNGLGTDGLPTGVPGTDGTGAGQLPPGATGDPSVPGQPSNQTSTPAGGPGSTEVPTESPTSDPTSPTSDAPSSTTAGGSITSPPTTADPTTTSAATTSVPTTSASPTTSTIPTTPTTPTTPITSTTPTVPTPPTIPTPPPAPALLSVSASAVSDAVAGSALTVSVTVTNTGGSPSPAGQAVVIQVPDGLSIGAILLASPLHTPRALAAAADPGCSQQGTEVTCTLPAIDPKASFVLSVALDVSPDVADGDITITLNGTVSEAQKIPLTVLSGYSSVQLSSPGEVALAPAAVNAVRLVATPKPGVRNPGRLTFGSTDFAVVGVSGDGGGCTVAAGSVSCPAAAVQPGVTLEVAVGAAAAAPPELVAIDQRGRSVSAATGLTIDRSGIGGYRSVHLASPGHLLRAGSTDTVMLTAVTLNAGVVNPGPITVPLRLSPGVRIMVDAGFPLPTGCQADADTLTCTPADGAVPAFALPVQVSAAASGDQQLTDAGLPAGTANLTDAADPLSVDPTRSGYDQITLAAAGPLTAGTMGTLTLDAAVGERVTEPGPVQIPRQLAAGLLVTAATGCERDGDTFRCPPAGSGNAAPVVTVAVLPLATADTVLAPARLDGDREQQIAGRLDVVQRLPGQRISLVGPFGGSSIGAPTLRCETPAQPTRNGCPGGLGVVAASSATLTVPDGARVISAELTWAATAPAVAPASTLDTVEVSIDGTRRATVHGVRPVGVEADATGANPVLSGRLFQRVASADAQQLLAAGVGAGSHTITISKLAARTIAAQLSPMGAWSLTVLWSTGSSPDAGVITDNRGLYSSSTRAGTVTTIEPAGNPVTAIYQTIWAPDPWGLKTLAIGDAPLTTAITGRHDNRLDGFELLHPRLPPAGLTGPITLTNRLTPPAALNPDGLWIGPSLFITAP